MNTLKSIKTIALLALASLFLASCASTTASSGVKPYPKETCIVTDNKLGSMGDPVTMVYKGQEVKFCCQPCVAKFNKDPGKYLSKLN